MAKIYNKILLFSIVGMAIIFSGCTGSQDITPVVKALPEVQQFMKEHPDAKITVTYWSKEEITKMSQEISQQCDRPITPVAMYKATISEGDLKLISWINAENNILLCSVTEGKGGLITPPTSTTTTTITPTPTVTATQTITETPTPVTTPATVDIKIKDFAFNPSSITITKGTTVVWTQEDSVTHTVTMVGSKGFDSGTLSQGQTFGRTFNDVGTFNYHCSIHSSMTGSVIVTETVTPSPSPTSSSVKPRYSQVFYDIYVDSYYGFYRTQRFVTDYETHQKVNLTIRFDNESLIISNDEVLEWINGDKIPLTIEVVSSNGNVEFTGYIPVGYETTYGFRNIGTYEIYVKEYPNLRHQRIVVESGNSTPSQQ